MLCLKLRNQFAILLSHPLYVLDRERILQHIVALTERLVIRTQMANKRFHVLALDPDSLRVFHIRRLAQIMVCSAQCCNLGLQLQRK
jgi:hypothetical protein